jgi:hypothetical protein
LTLDSWLLVLYNCKRAVGPGGLLFPIFCFLIGSYLITNMFISMLVYLYSEDEISTTLQKEIVDQFNNENQTNLKFAIINSNNDNHNNINNNKNIDNFSNNNCNDGSDDDDDDNVNDKKDSSKENNNKKKSASMIKKLHSNNFFFINSHFKKPNTYLYANNFVCISFIADKLATFFDKTRLFRKNLNTFYNTRIRTISLQIIENKYFENSIILLILLSSITLAIDNPLLNPHSQLSKALRVCDVLFTTIFTLEMALKMMALGFFSIESSVASNENNENNEDKDEEEEKNKPYFNVGWNILDFVIVVISILSLADVDGRKKTKSLKALRALRALRPLRLVHRLNGLKVIITAVFQSVTAVAQLATIYLLIYFMFAIFFTSFLKGQMRSCQGEVFEKNVLFSKNNSYYNLLLHPKHFSTLNELEKSWFGPNSTLNLNFKNSSSCMAKFENNEPCCDLNKFSFGSSVPTSRDVCECWLGEWSTDTVYRFFAFLFFFKLFYLYPTFCKQILM